MNADCRPECIVAAEVELKQFVSIRMTSRELEEDAAFPLVPFLLEQMVRDIREVMAEHGCHGIYRGPSFKREPWHRVLRVVPRSRIRRWLEAHNLADERYEEKVVGYRYRMEVWAA